MFKPRRFLTAAALLAALAASASAHRVFFVNPAVAQSGDGMTWGKAFKSIQEAINQSDGDDSVYCAAAIYRESLLINRGAKVYGGFVVGQVDLFKRKPLVHASVLIPPDNQRGAVILSSGELDGFFVLNGVGQSPGGGGVLSDGINNYVTGCVFVNCSATSGSGSAVHLKTGSRTVVENCVFVQNTAGGPAVHDDGTAAEIVHNLFYGNAGDGLQLASGSTARVSNNSFTLNGGRGVNDAAASNNPVVDHNHFHGNVKGPYWYRTRDLTGVTELNGLSFARRNITGDPKFHDPAKLDFVLTKDSPLIDQGIANLLFLFTDINIRIRGFDDPRLPGFSGNRDIGPHEWQGMLFHLTGSSKPGGTTTLHFLAPNDPGKGYQAATSLGTGPITLGFRFDIWLGFDPLLLLSVQGKLPAVFANYAGTLDANGAMQAAINLPNDSRLAGITIYSAVIVLDPAAQFGIKLASRPLPLTIG